MNMLRLISFITLCFLYASAPTMAGATDNQGVSAQKDNVNAIARKQQHNVSVEHKKELPSVQGSSIKKDKAPKESSIKQTVTNAYLWDLYKARQFTKARQVIQQTKTQYPNWSPDPNIEKALAEQKLRQKVYYAIQGNQFRSVATIYSSNPQMFSCERNQWRLFLIQGYLQQHKQAQALEMYNDILESCDFTIRLETLEHASKALDEKTFSPIFAQQLQWALSDTETATLKQLNYRRILHLAQQAKQNKNDKKVIRLANKLSAMILHTKHATMLETLAWLYFDVHQYKRALKHFKAAYKINNHIQALEGMAYAYLSLEHYKALRMFVDKHHAELRTSKVLPDIYVVLAGQALAQKNYQDSLVRLTSLKKIRPLQPTELEIYAWAKYHLAQFADAAPIFEQLYRKDPAESYAEGLYYSLVQLEQHPYLSQLAHELGGKLQHLVQAAQATSNPTQMLENPNVIPSQSGKKPLVQISQMERNRTGNFALSRMNLQKRMIAVTVPTAEFSSSNKTDSILFRFERFDIDLGDGTLPQPFRPNQPFNPGFPIGSMEDIGQNNYALPNIQTRHHGYEWSLGYAHNTGQSRYQAQLGQLVYDAANLTQLKVELSYVQTNDDYMYQLSAYKKPLRSSLLSYLGLPDPYKGVDYWGAVSRFGGEANGYLSLPNSLSLSGNLIAESREGEKVLRNTFFTAYAGLSYQLDWQDFLYFTAGPYLRWERSTTNQNYFTIGHGGYFSPQYLLDKGVGISFATATDKTWMIKSSASVGYQNIREDASPYFPLTSPTQLNAASYPSAVNAELHYQLNIAAVFTLNKQWQIHGAFLRNSSSVDYNENSYMLGITYAFHGHDKHVSQDDFPAYGLSPLY